MGYRRSPAAAQPLQFVSICALVRLINACRWLLSSRVWLPSAFWTIARCAQFSSFSNNVQMAGMDYVCAHAYVNTFHLASFQINRLPLATPIHPD